MKSRYRHLIIPSIFFIVGFFSYPFLTTLYGPSTIPLSHDYPEMSRNSLNERKPDNPSVDHIPHATPASSLIQDQAGQNWIDRNLLKKDLNITYAEQIPNQTKVFKWTGNKWQRLANFCTWSVFSHCSTLKTRNGNTPIFHHDPKNDFTSEILEKYGIREPENVEAILNYLGNDFSITFVDIGSHVGSIALQMVKVGYKIVTADPLPENILRLCKSVQTGNFVNNATILFTPVSDDHKTVEFIREWNIGATKVKPVSNETPKQNSAESSCKLPPLFSKTATLDDVIPFIKTHKVFLKIDVESHEYFVIKGGIEFFKQRYVVGIFMEWLHVTKTPEARDLIDLLSALGFKAYNLGKDGNALIYSDYMNWPFDIIWKRIIY